MSTEVKVKKSWSLMAFAKEFGKPEYLTNVNKETGEQFNSIGFRDEDGTLTLCHFSWTTQGYTKQDIMREKANLMVGINTNGKYTLYKGGLQGEEIEL